MLLVVKTRESKCKNLKRVTSTIKYQQKGEIKLELTDKHCEVLIVKFAENSQKAFPSANKCSKAVPLLVPFSRLSISPGLACHLSSDHDAPKPAVAVLQSCDPCMGGRLQQNADLRGPSTVLNPGHHQRAVTNG